MFHMIEPKLFFSAHAGFVQEVTQKGRGICTATAASHSSTLERGMLKRVPLVSVNAKRRHSYGAPYSL